VKRTRTHGLDVVVGNGLAILDPAEGGYSTLDRAGRQLGGLLGEQHVHPSTMYRWSHRGIAGVRLGGVPTEAGGPRMSC
jgi:hypothetical protein